jgi:hypothetical protein
MKKAVFGKRSHPEAGATLYLVAASLVVLLGMSALAIDLVSFYVVRNEAQRAADAGALAGATILAQGCTSASRGCVSGGAQETPATTQAIVVASTNLVGGQAPGASTVDVSFNYPNQYEPQVIVTVHRDTAKGNPMPTFFGKILGVTSADISAKAVAEGFTAAGVTCVRPFLVPNCDPNHPLATATTTNANQYCQCSGGMCGAGNDGKYMSYFFVPKNCTNCVGGAATGALINPGSYDPSAPSTSGVVGAPWTLHDNAGPSQWFTIAFTGQSGSNYRDNIYQCVPQVVSCANPLQSLNGNKVGPTTQGTETLIHASGYGYNQGQDTICTATSSPSCSGPPFPITGGSNNPVTGLRGQTFYSPSDSLATVAVFDPDGTNLKCNSSGCTGSLLSPGGSTVYISGYLQLFFRAINKSGGDDLIDTVITDVKGCGSNGPEINGGSPIAIRLIRQ